ncbi:MBL fold metallo-hydrolase [Christensenellaceae bacterium OttesenSCG-928-K19]|nr:MBL fold metallo-hydrolase [Christensenellaceae bacterium OttesenSCG-928-K19]
MRDFNVIDVTAYKGSDCFLILTEKSAVLVDSGQDYCAVQTSENISNILKGRQLDLILLTHSHYDHASGSACLKKAFPSAFVVASQTASEILAKEKVHSVMRELNKAVADEAGVGAYPDHLDSLAVDQTIEDGETITLDDLTITAIDASGHTKCSLCYYFEEEGLLAAAETLGIPVDFPAEISPCNIISHDQTIASIKRAASYKPQRILASHIGLLPDGSADEFFNKALEVENESNNLIIDSYKAGKPNDIILEEYKKRFYTQNVAKVQPENAFYINAETLIAKTIAKLYQDT